MTKTEAIELLRKYADRQEPFWGCTPEGRAWMCKFDEAIKVLSSDCENQNFINLLRESHKALYLVGCTPENSRRDSAEAEELQERILAAIGGI